MSSKIIEKASVEEGLKAGLENIEKPIGIKDLTQQANRAIERFKYMREKKWEGEEWWSEMKYVCKAFQAARDEMHKKMQDVERLRDDTDVQMVYSMINFVAGVEDAMSESAKYWYVKRGFDVNMESQQKIQGLEEFITSQSVFAAIDRALVVQ